MKSFIDERRVYSDGTLILQKEAKEIMPIDFGCVEEVVYRLKKGEGVVLKLEGLPVETAQRMLDFTTGAVYALDGEVKRVRGEKYLLIPPGVRITKLRERK